MKRIALIALVILLGLAVAFPLALSKAHARQDAALQIAQWERELPDAMMRRDTAFLARLTADDFVGYNPAGRKVTKADVLAQAQATDVELDSLRHDDIEVRVFGNAAVATAITVVKGRYRGADASGRFRYLHVWAKRQRKWQMVAAQSATLPEPAPARQNWSYKSESWRDREGTASAVPKNPQKTQGF